jgi:hypothetical protein
MGKNWILVILGAVVLALIPFFVSLFLVKIIWSWTIPDLFPGAVEQGLIAKEISWFTSFKIAVFVFILSILPRVKNSKSD